MPAVGASQGSLLQPAPQRRCAGFGPHATPLLPLGTLPFGYKDGQQMPHGPGQTLLATPKDHEAQEAF